MRRPSGRSSGFGPSPGYCCLVASPRCTRFRPRMPRPSKARSSPASHRTSGYVSSDVQAEESSAPPLLSLLFAPCWRLPSATGVPTRAPPSVPPGAVLGRLSHWEPACEDDAPCRPSSPSATPTAPPSSTRRPPTSIDSTRWPAAPGARAFRRSAAFFFQQQRKGRRALCLGRRQQVGSHPRTKGPRAPRRGPAASPPPGARGPRAGQAKCPGPLAEPRSYPIVNDTCRPAPLARSRLAPDLVPDVRPLSST